MIADYANKVNQITPAPALITYADKQGAPVEAFLAAGWSPRVVTRVVNNMSLIYISEPMRQAENAYSVS